MDRKWVNRGGLDLSKEVLWVFVGQKAAKIQAVKVGDLKKILPHVQDSNPGCPGWFESGHRVGFFSDLQLWQLVFLQPFDLQTPTVPLWKDLNLPVDSISVQESSSTFNVFYLHSKWPHFNRAYVVRVCNNLGSTVILEVWKSSHNLKAFLSSFC